MVGSCGFTGSIPATWSVGTPEAAVLAVAPGELTPDPPAAAAGQDAKVGHVLGAEAPGGVAPVGTVSQPAVGGLPVQHQQGLLVEQQLPQGGSGQHQVPEELGGGDAGARPPPAAQLLQAPPVLGELGRAAASALAPFRAVPRRGGVWPAKWLHLLRLCRGWGRIRGRRGRLGQEREVRRGSLKKDPKPSAWQAQWPAASVLLGFKQTFQLESLH